MPIIAAILDSLPKLPIEMMFKPLKFFGIPPYPAGRYHPRKAAIMSGIACDTLTSRLITPREVFSRLDPKRVAQELENRCYPS